MMVDDPALQFDRRSASDLKDKHRNVKAARYGSHVTNNIFKVGFKILSIVDMSHVSSMLVCVQACVHAQDDKQSF